MTTTEPLPNAEALLRLTCERLTGTPVKEQSPELVDIALAIDAAIARLTKPPAIDPAKSSSAAWLTGIEVIANPIMPRGAFFVHPDTLAGKDGALKYTRPGLCQPYPVIKESLKTGGIGAREAFRILDTGMLTYDEAEAIKALIQRLDREINDDTCVFQDIHGLGCRWAEDRGGRMLTCYHLRHPERWCGACIAEARLIGMSRNRSPEGR